MSNTSPVGRLSFPNLFKAEQINGQGEPKFGCTLIFDPGTPGLDKMRESVQKLINSKWNGKLPNKYKDPFLDGDEMDRPEYKGKIVIRFSCKADKRPEVVGPLKQPITDPAVIYAGCYCRVSYSCYTWEYMGKEGISFGLGHVQMVRNGERFDGRGTADSVFDEIEDDDSEYETESAEDTFDDSEVPF